MSSIYLVPVNLPNTDLIRRVRDDLKAMLHMDVFISDIHLEPELVFSAERQQYYSTQLLAQAIERSGNHKDYFVLLAGFDIYVPIFTFVFGEAQLNGRYSIVSLCRLHEEFYTGETNDELLFQRTMKEILHELGHNFGLIHCSNWECVMHSSSIIEEVDIKGSFYCKTCRSKTEQSIWAGST